MKKHLLKIIISVFFIVGAWQQSQAQNKKIDSLKILLKTAKEDTNKANILSDLSWRLKNIGNYDTALQYANTALSLSEKLNFKRGLSAARNGIGLVYFYKGNYAEALKNYFIGLKIREELGDKKAVAYTYGNIGNVYNKQGNYVAALANHFKCLKAAEEIGDKRGISNSRTNIGNIYYLQENFSEALVNYTAALKIQTENNDKQGIAGSYTNIGEVYRNQKKLTEALNNQLAACKIQEEIGNQDGLSNAYSNIGLVYYDKGKYNLAIDNYLISLHLKEKIGDEQGMAWSYASLSEAYIKLKKYAEAEAFAIKSLNKATEIGELDDVKQAEFNLSEIYEKTGKSQQALIHFKSFIAVRDSLFSQENAKKTVQQQMQYDFDKKETASKLEQEKRDAITASEKKKQQIIIAAVSVGLILMLILAGVILRSLRINQKKNQIIMHQKDLVEEKQKEILDSIHYAKRIQQALLTSVKYIERHLTKGFFILYKPKDIVSGDFYYALSHKVAGSNKELFYLCTADCTGHGVPGAFMSMLGISHLNESIIEKNISMPHEILNAMRSEIIRSLNPEGSEEESKDGMDAVLCCYDFQSMKLYFAAANNPLWLVRNGVLKEYKPDKMPIGKYHDETISFTLQTIDLQKGDTIYTFTDGYADQFGGQKGKKFKFKQLEEMLLANSNLPMEEQKDLLSKVFENWKGKLEQIDDVCVIGVRI